MTSAPYKIHAVSSLAVVFFVEENGTSRELGCVVSTPVGYKSYAPEYYSDDKYLSVCSETLEEAADVLLEHRLYLDKKEAERAEDLVAKSEAILTAYAAELS